MATCAGWFSLPDPHSRLMWKALQQHLPSCWRATMAQVRPDTVVIHFTQCWGLKHAQPGKSCMPSRLTAQPCTLSAQKQLGVVRPDQDVCPCAGHLAFVAAAANNLHLLGAILQQACQVCSLALESIMLHCDAHLAELQQPRQISSTSSPPGLSPLVEVLLRLTGTSASLLLYSTLPWPLWKP